MVQNFDLFGEVVEPRAPFHNDKKLASIRYRNRISRAIEQNISYFVATSDAERYPQIGPYSYSVPEHFVLFGERKNVTDPATTMLHFFTDDYRFSRILRKPESYIDELKRYHSVVFPDASQYMDMASSKRMLSNRVNKQIGQLWQKAGVRIVVNATWSDSASFDYCFDGLPTGCMVAVSSLGLRGNPYSVRLWRKGYEQMLERLRPSRIIRYGKAIPGEDASISTYFDVEHLNRMRSGRKR